MEETHVRTLVAFTTDKYKLTIPDYVLYINTDTNMLCLNKDGVVYIVNCLYSE